MITTTPKISANEDRDNEIVEKKKTMSYRKLSVETGLSINRLQDIVKGKRGVTVKCPKCGENIQVYS